jgi:hypothetical protein
VPGECYGLGVKKLVLLIVLACCGTAAEPPREREREILTERPSGFWTSNRPAEGGAYKWRLLGIGVVIVGVMGVVILRTLRRTRR